MKLTLKCVKSCTEMLAGSIMVYLNKVRQELGNHEEI